MKTAVNHERLTMAKSSLFFYYDQTKNPETVPVFSKIRSGWKWKEASENSLSNVVIELISGNSWLSLEIRLQR